MGGSSLPVTATMAAPGHAWLQVQGVEERARVGWIRPVFFAVFLSPAQGQPDIPALR